MYNKFERLCDERGVKPADVAKDTGIAKATLSAWKNGEYQPKGEKIFEIAKYFGVPMETFYTETEET